MRRGGGSQAVCAVEERGGDLRLEGSIEREERDLVESKKDERTEEKGGDSVKHTNRSQ